MRDPAVLASRRDPRRDLAFLEAAGDVPVEQRVACFDNDGTLWCEKPTYVQLDFFVDAMKGAVARRPERRASGRSSPR